MIRYIFNLRKRVMKAILGKGRLFPTEGFLMSQGTDNNWKN